jgi:hypothetical protein
MRRTRTCATRVILPSCRHGSARTRRRGFVSFADLTTFGAAVVVCSGLGFAAGAGFEERSAVPPEQPATSSTAANQLAASR